jgi:hypothetical protein
LVFMREGQALVFDVFLGRGRQQSRTTHSRGFTDRLQRDMQAAGSRGMCKRHAPEGCDSVRPQRDAQAAGFVFEFLVSKCWFSFVLMSKI